MRLGVVAALLFGTTLPANHWNGRDVMFEFLPGNHVRNSKFVVCWYTSRWTLSFFPFLSTWISTCTVQLYIEQHTPSIRVSR